MQQKQLEFGKYYHIYNHAVGGRNLFREPDNYEYFLFLLDKHISIIAETYAWVLMPNHFHLLVRIKEKKNIISNLDLTGFENLSGLKKTKPLHQYFSNLFNAYTKAYNKYHSANGTLFERPFKRKLIEDKEYLRKAILYIHKNPVHHKFCEHPLEYPWSSYLACTSIKPTKIRRKEVIDWFENDANFKTRHNRKMDWENFNEWLEI